MQVEYQSRLQTLLSRSENNTCVDCNASNPTWATLIKNRKEDDAASSSTLLGGAFACANCIGAHRKLGTHIVFAKSVSLDRWNINEIETMECNTSGNATINLLYEAALLDEMEETGVLDIKPTVNTDARCRERFVVDKYAHRRWYRPKKNVVENNKVKLEKSKEEEEFSHQPVISAVEYSAAIQDYLGLTGEMTSTAAAVATEKFNSSTITEASRAAVVENGDQNVKHSALIQAVVDKHRADTIQMLSLSAAQGQSCVPSNTMTARRYANLNALAAANQLVYRAGGHKLPHHELKTLLAKAEEDAGSSFQKGELQHDTDVDQSDHSEGLIREDMDMHEVDDEYEEDDDDDKELELSISDLQILVKNKREIGVRGKDSVRRSSNSNSDSSSNFVELLELSLRDLMLSDQFISTSKYQQRRRSKKKKDLSSSTRHRNKSKHITNKSGNSEGGRSSNQNQRHGHHHYRAKALIPKDVHLILECARGGNVLPREIVVSDIVCLLLDCSKKKKINDQDIYSACMVAISVDISQHDHHEGGNGGGEGKTTIAALVCMRSDIRTRYHRGMAWLSIGHHHSCSSSSRHLNRLDFNTYCRALIMICNQIGIKSHPEWSCPIPMIRPTGDENDAITQLRLLKCMRDARSCMGELLTTLTRTRDERSTKNSILIILDDVIDQADIEWFQFCGVEEGDQINDLLITSRISEFENDDVQVYLAPPLEMKEAVSILLTESDLSVNHPLANCNAVMHLVREGLLHPLIIKFFGRFICLRYVTSGGREEYECIIDEIRDVIRTSSSGNGETTVNVLWSIMDHALTPRIGGNKTSIFRLCFVALVTVFYKDNCTTMISKEVVSDYFKEIIEMESDALVNDHFYRKNGVKSSKLVLEILGALSIVNFTKHSPTKGSTISEITVQIDHDLFRQFSHQILDDNSMLYFGKREDVEIRWNEAYIKSYTGQTSNYLWDNDSVPDRSRRYALENFPAHMIRADMLDELEILLQNEDFIRARFRSLGWMETTRAHVSDSEAFAYVNNQTLVVIFNKVEAVLMSEVTGKSCPKGQCNALEAGRCLHEISLSLVRLKIWDEAYRLCDLSVQLVQNELDPPELVASLLYNLSVICMKDKKFDEAETSIANCLKMAVKSNSGIDNILYVGALCQLGDILQRTESYKRAEATYSDALQIVQALEGDQTPLLIQIFIGMADLLVATSNFDDAVGYYTQCLEMQERLLGKEHEDIASIMYSMGLAMLEKGSFVEALDYFSISLDMRVHLHGENHQIIADTYDMMGFVEAKSGDLDASLQLLTNSLELRKLIGDKLREADTLVNIGNLFRERKDYEHALHQYNECLMIRITALGRNHILVADMLKAIGNVHGDMNNISDALGRYREAVEIFASVNGPADLSVGITVQKVGILQVRAGNLESGRLFLEQAVDIYRQLGQEYESNLVIPYFVIGNIHKMFEETNEAMLAWTDAYEICTKMEQLGSNLETHQALTKLLHVIG